MNKLPNLRIQLEALCLNLDLGVAGSERCLLFNSDNHGAFLHRLRCQTPLTTSYRAFWKIPRYSTLCCVWTIWMFSPDLCDPSTTLE